MRKPDASDPSRTYLSDASCEAGRGYPVPASTYSASDSCSMPKKMMIKLLAPAITMPPIVQKINRAAYEPGLLPSSALRSDESRNVIASVSSNNESKVHENRSAANAPLNVTIVRPYSGSMLANAARQLRM